MGSPVSVTGMVSGVIGIVPGPPEGVRGSTGWGHLPRWAKWAEKGREPAPGGLVRPPKGPKAPRVRNPRGWGRLPPSLGGKFPPLAATPPLRWDLRGPAPSLLLPINRRGVGGQQYHIQGATLPL